MATMISDTVGDWQELSALYEHADVLAPAELSAWLERLRANKHRLLRQVERMLAARSHLAGGSFLETLPKIGAGGEDSTRFDWVEGSAIGAYRLVRHIGAGGMAEVWLAERADGAFERQVAIKLLFSHPTRSQREGFVERFRRERDILASLDHPNVARLHDAGVTPSGQPWLALEYVEGAPITAWCDQRQLSIERRVRLFIDVLRAVEHAHSSLIIHRDLKPANILVTTAGEVRLLDFGIAKVLAAELDSGAETELTRREGRPLTLQYASPEQVSGRALTTSTDVYSLGVVLYELLVGRRPYDDKAGSAAQLERAILDFEPATPSKRDIPEGAATARGSSPKTLAKTLCDGLDAVVLKSLSKALGTRYGSVEAMRQDLQRWLASKPVLAKSPSLAYYARKFFQRHRLGVLAAAGSFTALTIASVTAVVMGVRATEQSTRAVAAKSFLVDMFRDVDSETSKGSDITAAQILESGTKKALATLAPQPDLQAEVLRGIGQMQSALAQYKLAEVTFAKLIEIEASRGDAEGLASARIEAAFNANQVGNVQRAARLIAEVEHTASGAFLDKPLQARLLYVKGLVADADGDAKSAREYLEAALRLTTQNSGEAEQDAIRTLRALANIESFAGNHRRAEERIREAANRAASATGNTPRGLFGIEYDAVLIEFNAGNYAGLPQRLAALSSRCDTLFGARREDCMIVANLWASTLLRTGDRRAALGLLPRLLDQASDDAAQRRQLLGFEVALRVLASNHLVSTQPAIRAQLASLATGSEQSSEDRSYAMIALAEADLSEGKATDAEGWALKALSLQQESDHPGMGVSSRARNVLGLALQAQGKHEAALAMLRAAAKQFGSAMGETHTLVQYYRLNQVASLAGTGRVDEAVVLLDGILPALIDGMGAHSPIVEQTRQWRARLRNLAAGRAGVLVETDFFT